MKRYDVWRLNCQDCTSVHYLETLVQRFSDSWSDNEMLEEKWKIVKDAVNTVAQDVLGCSSHRQLDWFADSLGHLQPLTVGRNKAYSKWISTCKPEDLVAFKKARGEAKRAIQE